MDLRGGKTAAIDSERGRGERQPRGPAADRTGLAQQHRGGKREGRLPEKGHGGGSEGAAPSAARTQAWAQSTRTGRIRLSIRTARC